MHEEAIKWWKELTSEERVKYWLEYKQANISPSFNSSELTGREIEIIYSDYLKDKI